MSNTKETTAELHKNAVNALVTKGLTTEKIVETAYKE